MLLLRGLVELWADFIYMIDKRDPVERRIRAIEREREREREIAATNQLIRTLNIPDIADPVDAGRSIQMAQDRLRRLQSVKRSEGWTVRGRPYGDVKDWLNKVGPEWPSLMYRGFSDAAHHRATEWALDEVNPATWHFKASRLEQCLVIYGNIACSALELIRPTAAGGFRQAVEDLNPIQSCGCSWRKRLRRLRFAASATSPPPSASAPYWPHLPTNHRDPAQASPLRGHGRSSLAPRAW